MHTLSQGDISTYFTGVRAPTFEEDFIIEMGRKTGNILHCAGIQSPGLTTAPAVALDIEKMAVDYLSTLKPVEKNENYDPIRHGPPILREMSEKHEETAEYYRKNVTLVKNYERMNDTLQTLVVNNTRATERLTTMIEATINKVIRR